MLNIFGYEISYSELISDLLVIVLSLVYSVRTHGLKNTLKEVTDMVTKFKTVQTAHETKGQTFPSTKPVMRYNKATGELETTDETFDLQAFIESSLEVSLSRVLQRLLPAVEDENDKAFFEYKSMQDDIDELVKVQNIAEDYRLKYDLSDELSIEQIFDFVQKKALDSYKKVFSNNTEVKKDEAQTDEKIDK